MTNYRIEIQDTDGVFRAFNVNAMSMAEAEATVEQLYPGCLFTDVETFDEYQSRIGAMLVQANAAFEASMREMAMEALPYQ